MPDWDIAIIGGGASGLTAAATAAANGLSTLLIDRMGGGGELMNLGPLHGLDEPLTGPDLFTRLLEDTIAAGAELSVAEVTGLTQTPTGWRIATGGGTHHARAVILAIGLAPGTMGIGNEQDFEGQGLSHCAACDGPLYAGQPVVVAGGDRWAQQEARDLAAIASSVTLVTQGAPSPAMENVAVIPGHVTALEGAGGLESVTVQADDGSTPQRLPASAIFVQTGRRPALHFAPETLARDPNGRLIVSEALETSLPALFAAGDARAGSPGTFTAAMDDGRRAASAPLGKTAKPE